MTRNGNGQKPASARRPLSRRHVLKQLAGGAAVSLAAPLVIRGPAAAADTLYVNSYGGVLESSQVKAFFAPFTAATGIQCLPVSPVSYAKLAAQVQTGSYDWDVTNMSEVEFAQAEYDKLVQPLDPAILKPDMLPAGMVQGNGVASFSLATNLAYLKSNFPKGGPKSWADFWDVKKFPGTRGMYNRHFTSLACALIADGVPRDKLYPLDLDRAFRKLDQIKPHIKVWWADGSQSQQLLRDGEVEISSIWSARGADLMKQGVDLELVWNEAEIVTAYWFAAKGTPRASQAFKFMAFAGQAQPQAEFTKLLPYGPTNPGAVPLVPEAMAKVTPSWPDNLKLEFSHDARWLAPRLAEIRERWNQWLAS